MAENEKLQKAFITFDAYNANDPNQEEFNGVLHPKELLYAQRMTEKLQSYFPEAPEYLQLAARCQHIGRWEIPRNTYAMDRKGYLQWRSFLKFHHARIAEQVLRSCRYDDETIEKVKFLLLKKELQTNADTQILEDVVCLVFIEYYLDAFARQHEDHKVVDILKKTMKKMSAQGIQEAGKINVSERIRSLLAEASK